MLRRGHGRVTIFHFRNTRISKENSWWSKVGKVITHFSSRRVARIPPPPEVMAPFRRDSNDPGRSCGHGNGDGEGSGANGGGRWGGGWRAPPRATGPGAGAAHCWALRGAATCRARAGRRSRYRRWTRAGGVRGRVHLQGPACAAGRDRGRVCASDSGAPPTRPAHGGVGRARHAGPRPPSEPTRRSVGGPKAPPGARQPLAPSPTATAAPPNAVPTTPSATGLPPPGTKPPPASPAPATGSHNTPCTCTCTCACTCACTCTCTT